MTELKTTAAHDRYTEFDEVTLRINFHFGQFSETSEWLQSGQGSWL